MRIFRDRLTRRNPCGTEETRDAIYDWGLDWAFFNYATPLRGSELFRQCKENKWIDEKYLPIGAIDMTDYVITAPGMDRDEIKNTVFAMNLDLNFVHNSNLRKGNLKTAYQTFREVVDRHPTQPFAQYFLAKCLESLGIGQGKVNRHYEIYRGIIQESKTWRDAALRFGLELEPKISAARRQAAARLTSASAHQTRLRKPSGEAVIMSLCSIV